MPLLKCSAGKATPRKAIAYITDPEKAEYISVRNLFDDEDYAEQFKKTQNMYGKCKDYRERKYYHFKLSCARQDNVNPQEAQRYAEELAEKLFPDEECVIATHTDTKTVHSHIIVNAVNPVTGKKLHFTDEEYGEMKDEANSIGKRYGFSETDWRKKAKNKRTSEEKHIILKGGTSWKEELREVIEEGVLSCDSPEQFKVYLRECYGVEITRDGKDYSYLHPQKERAIRGERLGANYTKSEVIKRLGKQNYRKTSGTDNGRNNRSRVQSAANGAWGRGGQTDYGSKGSLVAEGIGAIEREMQQLNSSAEYAGYGLDAASEERKRDQHRISEELERLQREPDERSEQSDSDASEVKARNNTRGSNSYGKGD